MGQAGMRTQWGVGAEREDAKRAVGGWAVKDRKEKGEWRGRLVRHQEMHVPKPKVLREPLEQ
jgi:hypothetical protein